MISIENKIDENIEIKTDRRLLSIVLNNLIANAIKYSPQNSTIIISAKQEDKNVLLSVKDNGIGMSKKTTDQLFFTNGNIEKTENSGTGLGLIVSKEIVDSLSGEIWAESTLNKGTEIFIKL